MKKNHLLGFFAIGLLFSGFIFGRIAYAESAEKLSGDGSIEFEAYLEPPVVIDPEFPEKPVDPGPSPSTDGYLRLDFVPRLDFGRNRLSSEDQTYSAAAQLFLDDTPARGNYVQVTDSRATGAGWTLQVRQEKQFTSVEDEKDVLKGAYISLDKAWANSKIDSKYAPLLKNDVIKIDQVETTYDLAVAEEGTGHQTWAVEFGASADNEAGLASTLSPMTDQEGQPLLDPLFNNQQKYSNSAVTLFVPGKTEKKPVRYQTVLTWIIAELP